MIKYIYKYIFPVFIVCILLFSSCNKIENREVTLEFSVEELTFDTVFTTVGTITRNFTVYNPSKEDVLADIHLAGAPHSYFSINVDGLAGTDFKDVLIPARDSIFIHVKANLHPGNQNTPFLITDSIVFRNNGKTQDINLLAYGQDANFIVADAGSGNLRYKIIAGAHETVHWTNEKPYVVYGWAAVDSLGTLIIEPGTQVYFHNNSGIWVYSYGSIQANGTPEEPITFRGDRLEPWYDSDFAQWSRIWINEGYGENRISNVLISNAQVGIQIEPLTTYTRNKTTIENSIIKNCRFSGVIARYANLEMNNCLITNCGDYCLDLEVGTFDMKHLTIANYFSQDQRETPALFVSDSCYALYGGGETKANFYNTIIFGDISNELVERKHDYYGSSYNFYNCLIRTTESSTNFHDCLLNQNPNFVNHREYDFQLEANSPAINAGLSGIGITTDLLNNPRDGQPDIGAYERLR